MGNHDGTDGRLGRRQFLGAAAAVAAGAFLGAPTRRARAAERPNILWLTCEDTSPDLGCYGDDYAVTPSLDAFAGEAALFSSAFSISGVCAPSRSALITGMYPSSIGTHHMRCQGVPPRYVSCFTEYLRQAGYYCTNNSKTDYNFPPPITAWDENGREAHYRNRPDGMPFFSVFNTTVTHESQIRADDDQFARNTRRLTDDQRHDPDQAVVPPYYPDTDVTRTDWARYYDLVTAMDYWFGDRVAELDEQGLADNTIVFFYGDHGRGLPRAKRWIYDSGIHVPLLVRWPGVLDDGVVIDDLVSFVDFAPTVLSLAGVPVPEYMQGRPFLGDQAAEPREMVYAARDRMDEAVDIVRAVRDDRFKYIRNFQAMKPYAQYIDYMEKMPTMREMRRLNKEGKLEGAEKQFFLPEKPEEELYDTAADPHEVSNLAGDPGYRHVLERMRHELAAWMDRIDDLALIPEDELNEQRRPGGVWEVTRKPEITIAERDGRALATLSCPTPGASIAYTTDEGDDAHWWLYSGPVPVEKGTQIRAKACRLGYRDSDVVSEEI
ncbi:MAG: sulfatase-like hydrolase/transferase [Armatimonadia bacterium]|nr:sulfatase-like hydrolase/transferase [Armatimonadia bacterium]